PYVGLYADYYFNSDDATLPLVPLLLPTQFVQGWSARVTGGVGVTTAGGARVSLGGEVGGLGSDQYGVWSRHSPGRLAEGFASPEPNRLGGTAQKGHRRWPCIQGRARKGRPPTPRQRLLPGL